MKPDDTNSTDTTASEEKDFILKIGLGVVLPMRIRMRQKIDGAAGETEVDMDSLVAVSTELRDRLMRHIEAFETEVKMVEVLAGEAMSAEDFEKERQQVKQQAAAVAGLLQALAGTLPEGMQMHAMVNGKLVAVGGEDKDNGGARELTDDSDPPADDNAVQPVEEAPAVEPSPDAFRAPGSRAIN